MRLTPTTAEVPVGDHQPNAPRMRDLVRGATTLRELHEQQLVLANAWDRPTARLIESLGFPAVATTSAAVAALHGVPDADVLDPDLAFASIDAIASAVTVPVTADLEAGYGLDADDLVARLLAAGAVGCNLEDSAHHHDDASLASIDDHADRIAAVREAATGAGVEIVINARIDTYLHCDDPGDSTLEATIARGRAYRSAGADCIYPILVTDPEHIAVLVREVGSLNVLTVPGVPSVPELFELGVSRVSMGSGLFKLALESVGRAAGLLRAHQDWWQAWPDAEPTSPG